MAKLLEVFSLLLLQTTVFAGILLFIVLWCSCYMKGTVMCKNESTERYAFVLFLENSPKNKWAQWAADLWWIGLRSLWWGDLWSSSSSGLKKTLVIGAILSQTYGSVHGVWCGLLLSLVEMRFKDPPIFDIDFGAPKGWCATSFSQLIVTLFFSFSFIQDSPKCNLSQPRCVLSRLS